MAAISPVPVKEDVNADVDVLHLEDLQHSAELSTDIEHVEKGYFSGVALIGGLMSISISVTATFWAFIPATSVIVFINEDIGPSPNASQFSLVWTLCSSVAFLFTALSDKFGRRWFVIGASIMGLMGGALNGRMWCTSDDL